MSMNSKAKGKNEFNSCINFEEMLEDMMYPSPSRNEMYFEENLSDSELKIEMADCDDNDDFSPNEECSTSPTLGESSDDSSVKEFIQKYPKFIHFLNKSDLKLLQADLVPDENNLNQQETDGKLENSLKTDVKPKTSLKTDGKHKSSLKTDGKLGSSLNTLQKIENKSSVTNILEKFQVQKSDIDNKNTQKRLSNSEQHNKNDQKTPQKRIANSQTSKLYRNYLKVSNSDKNSSLHYEQTMLNLPEEELVNIPSVFLNAILRPLPRSTQISIKQKRRRLKNRYYAQICRSKRQITRNNLEIENDKLKSELSKCKSAFKELYTKYILTMAELTKLQEDVSRGNSD